MGLVNFAGKLPVAVILQWQGDVVSGRLLTKAFAPFRYVIANDFVSAFKISVGGGTPFDITRTATKGNRFYDDALNTFTTAPVPGPALDDLIDATTRGVAVPCAIDMTFTYQAFFDVLLEQMTRTDADLHNLANPNDSKKILDTFVHSAAGGNITITYKSKTEKISGLNCVFKDQQVTPRAGKAPAVKLLFELDFSSPDDAKRAAMRKLIAMDWSKLAKFGKAVTDKEPMLPTTKVWFNNRNTYVINHTDTDRSEKLRQSILNRHNGKSPQVLAKDLRDDIDLHLVTANHWGQAREDMKTERHQRLLSDLFGTLHQKVWLASPVCCLRTIDKDILTQPFVNAPISDRGVYAGLALQYGVGHCGEHAETSFSILKSMISNTGSPVHVAVQTGNANIDHAFVVYELDVNLVTVTIPTNPKNTHVAKLTDPFRVWNLADGINDNPSRTGFVMDPYLDRTVMKSTAKELLAALHRPDRVKLKKDTDWLAYDAQFFTPLGIMEDDLTGEPENIRKSLVPNV